MGRTVVKRVDQTRNSKPTSRLIVAGAAAILLFAIIGVVSAGAFVAAKVSGGSSTPTHPATTSSPGPSPSLQDVARAQAQATAIVLTAQQTSRAIVADATTRAGKKAASIVSAARRKSVAVANHPAPAAAPAVVPTSPPVPQPVVSGATAAGAPSYNASSLGQTVPPAQPYVVTRAPTGAGSSPNLSGLPASWLVVGYNATFGSGPGSAGSISVVNRSGKLFSGVARVAYSNGTSANAPFSNLAPGQSVVLPLNGPAYRGGGYHIVVNVR
ncbi:MAG: hypothetical protein NVS2B16_13960 [Chloroflexota bacterium]